MKPQIFLAGALALALVPGAILISGCGGGGGSTVTTPNLRFSRQSNVEFPDSPQISGVLTINFVDTAPNVNARAAGTLQLFTTPAGATTPTPFPDPPPGAGTVDFLSVLPGNATYILVGNVVPSNGADADIALDLRGSYEDSPPFTLRGNFVDDAKITLEAKFNRGNSVLRGRIRNVNNAILPSGTPTAQPTTTATAGGATTAGTTTTGATTTGATTNGATTNGATTTGATTMGATTTGATTNSATTTGATTTGATTNGATTGSSTTGATTVGLPPSLP